MWKFTLKPPNSITHDKLQLAIWDISFWIFWSNLDTRDLNILGPILVIFETCHFLGGLSLHLNHLIESCMTNYDWPFGTLPFGLFGSNLDTRDL